MKKINKLIEEFLKEKILPYYDIITDVSDLVQNDAEKSHAELIKNILLELITDIYKDGFNNTTELDFYSELKKINLRDENIQRIIKQTILNRLQSYGLPENILARFTFNELLKIYMNYHFIDKIKSTVKQIYVLLNLFNVQLLSVAELYIRKINNDLVFIPKWIYKDELLNEDSLPKYFTYDEIYNSTPGYLIKKEDLLNNEDKIIYPIKTNILLLYYRNTENLSLSTYLNAAYIYYLLNDEIIKINLQTIDDKEIINANDSIYIFLYLSLLELRRNNNNGNNNNEKESINAYIFQLPYIVDYISANEDEYLKYLNKLQTLNSTSSNELYKTRREIINWIKNNLMLYDTVEIDSSIDELTNTIEDFISTQYPKLFQDIQNIYQYKNSNTEKYKQLHDNLVTEILNNLLNKISEVISKHKKNVSAEMVLAYIYTFIQYLVNIEHNEIYKIYSKYILLLKYLQPAYILYAEPHRYNQYYTIENRNLNGLYIYSEYPKFNLSNQSYSFFYVTETQKDFYIKTIQTTNNLPDIYNDRTYVHLLTNYRYILSQVKDKILLSINAANNFSFYQNITEKYKISIKHKHLNIIPSLNLDLTNTKIHHNTLDKTNTSKENGNIDKVSTFTLSNSSISILNNVSEKQDNVVIVNDYYSVPLHDDTEVKVI